MRLHLFTVVATTVLTGCAAPVQWNSGFLSDYSVLRPSAFDNVLLYKAANFDTKSFKLVTVSAAQFHGSSPQLRELAPEFRREILAHLDAEIAQRVKAALGAEAERGFKLRTVVTNVETPNRTQNSILNVASTLLLGPVEMGGAAMEIELTDATSGQLLMAATCAERGHPFFDQFNAYSVLGHARIAISACMKHFEKAYRG